jgi:hypothetical protein
VPRDGRTPSYPLWQVFVRSHDRLESYASACWSMSNLSVPGGWTCVITPGRVTPLPVTALKSSLSPDQHATCPRREPEPQSTARTGRPPVTGDDSAVHPDQHVTACEQARDSGEDGMAAFGNSGTSGTAQARWTAHDWMRLRAWFPRHRMPGRRRPDGGLPGPDQSRPLPQCERRRR